MGVSEAVEGRVGTRSTKAAQGWRGLLTRVALLALVPALFATNLCAQQTGALVGRVLDENTLEPISGVLVRVRGGGPTGLTTADGRFSLRNVPAGPLVLDLEHVAYGEHLRSTLVQADREVRLQIRLLRRSIQLAPLVVRAVTELDRRRASTGNSMNEIQRAAIERAASTGINLGQLLQNEMMGIRVRAGPTGPHSCVEYRGSVNMEGECDEVSVFLDGVPVTVPSALFPHMPLADIERLEVMSPGQAGALYGASGGTGVLLIETRRGIRPQRPQQAEALSAGLDWSLEEKPYPWAKVVGSAMIGNALGLGLSLGAADQCFRVRTRGILGVRERCNALTTMLSGFLTLGLPGTAGTYGARWAGGTARSQGRALPGLLMGSMSAGAGYLLIVEGEGDRSNPGVIAGAALLTLGTPLILTFTDRAFRLLR